MGFEINHCIDGYREMKDEQLRNVAAAGLVIGALLGMAGSFAPTAEPWSWRAAAPRPNEALQPTSALLKRR